ncbi:MAG: hypothetical protein COV67_06395 [Nitrospinae bacterium CG11_big_fil_rev_8_21_14_0_20_56_8]|nr:MAG: hypothetical protein COV67_06395 [Nitrospinae bacterium CG11_big_fil_rev_8_21_14_0_20_56_8]
MNFNKLLILNILLVILGACSQGDKSEPQVEVPTSAEEETASVSGEGVGLPHEVIPVQLTPEQEKKAKAAPEGMQFIPGGCFVMGNNFAQEDERPEHEVCVDDFFIDKTEVTQARWEKVMGFNPSKFIDPNRPVEQVNFYDVERFVKKSAGNCRLPTEAEWEYAASGGVQTRYYWGNMMDDNYAWYMDNSGGTTHPVGQKKINQYGLYDMMGNVWEWTNDWWEALYQVREKENPQGPAQGEFKVVRGGSFDSSAGALRATNRTWLHPKNRVFPKVTTYGQTMNEVFNYIGFRCARSLNPKATPPAPVPPKSAT